MATRYGKKDKWKPVNAPDWVQPEDSNGQDNVPEADIEPAVVTEKVPKKEERGESYTFSVGHDANGAPSSREERKEKRAQRKADKATAEKAPAEGIRQPVADNVRPIGSPDWVPSEESAGTQAVPVADKYHEVHTFGKADPEDMPSAKDIKAQERDARKTEREARKAEREASRSDRPAEAVQDASGTAPEQSATPGPKAAETAQEQPAAKPAVTVDENAGEGQPKAAVQAQQEKKDGAEPEGAPAVEKKTAVESPAAGQTESAGTGPALTATASPVPETTSAETDYETMLGQWEQYYKDRLASETAVDEKAARQERNNQMWGGITEVAANIANLIGTTTGAASQPIQSKQDTWYSRAQAARQEREARRERYASQLQALQSQKAQLQYKRQEADKTRAYNVWKTMSDNAYKAQQLEIQREKADVANQYTIARMDLIEIQKEMKQLEADYKEARTAEVRARIKSRMDELAQKEEYNKARIANIEAKTNGQIIKNNAATPAAPATPAVEQGSGLEEFE